MVNLENIQTGYIYIYIKQLLVNRIVGRGSGMPGMVYVQAKT